MTNDELNKIHKDGAKEEGKKYYWHRIGNCTHEKCGGACCRIAAMPALSDDKYFMKGHYYMVNPIKIIKQKKVFTAIIPFHCPEITIDGKCKIHGTNRQSYICQHFPMTPEDSVYCYVKDVCGYKF